uniref:ABC transmembrane type-1 domain-containing protein n=1 Tax=Globodera pallida TaxID=36090 RepID=A0A183BJ76_GLOPA
MDISIVPLVLNGSLLFAMHLGKNLFMLLILFVGVAPDIISDVKDMSTALATASAPPVDFLKELGRIAAKTAIMLKWMGPIGALVVTSAKIGFPVDSKEFTAIVLLNQSIHQRFGLIDIQHQKSTERIMALVFDLAYLEIRKLLLEGILY